MSVLAAVFLGWAVVATMMAALWLVQWARRDAGWVDVGWACGIGIVAVLLAALVPGDPLRRWLVAGLVAVWSFRLGAYLLTNRVLGKPEDGRYQTLRARWGPRAQPYFFLFFQAQALLDVMFALPLLVAMLHPARPLGVTGWLGIAVWLVAVGGESVADRQLARFRADPANRGRTCQMGLWRYSRHPNYFFELVHWFAYVLLAIGAPHWWLSLLGPALMAYFLLKVTGIPATEAQALRTRPDYAEYQRTTSAFVPWPRRKGTGDRGMSGMLEWGIWQAELGRVPDWLIRVGIRRLLAARLREEGRGGIEGQRERMAALLAHMRQSPIALATAAANEQHYEVPPELFELALGPRLKYSACAWPEGVRTLAEAEETTLALTCERAELADGQRILELGCGWGSLSLWMAERYPGARILAVSNSAPQRAFIEARRDARGLSNLEVVAADMNHFAPEGRFDRVVSVEMLEHMRNWEALCGHIAAWLAPGGKLFVHIFCHRAWPYVFATVGAGNWMGRHFFTGGLMPSDDLLLQTCGELRLERRWALSGRDYARTLLAWLGNHDAARERVLPILARTYGAGEARRWFGRWRLFYLACAELFGWAGGDEWYVAHYRLRR